MSQPHLFYDTKDGVHTAFTTTYTFIPFHFYTKGMIIIAPYNTNTDDVIFSWDGATIAGVASVSSYAINLQNVVRNGIYVKAKTSTQDAMITAY